MVTEISRLAEGDTQQGCGFSSCKSSPGWAPCSLSQSEAGVMLGWCWGDAGGFEVLSSSALFHHPCQCFPQSWADAEPTLISQNLLPTWVWGMAESRAQELVPAPGALCHYRSRGPQQNFSSAQEATEQTTKLEHRAVPTTNEGLKFNFWCC